MPLLSILHAAGRLSTRGACDAMSPSRGYRNAYCCYFRSGPQQLLTSHLLLQPRPQPILVDGAHRLDPVGAPLADVMPGNLHRPDKGRKYMALYWTLLDFPSWMLQSARAPGGLSWYTTDRDRSLA